MSISVTWILNNTEQPEEGYLPLNKFEEIIMNNQFDNEPENVSASITGMITEFLTESIMMKNIPDKKDIISGANKLNNHNYYLSSLDNNKYNHKIRANKIIKYFEPNLTKASIKDALILMGYKKVNYLSDNFSQLSLNNISALNGQLSDSDSNIIIQYVQNSIDFLNKNKQTIINSGIEISITQKNKLRSKYESKIEGVIDFITNDTLWDMKVRSTEPTKEDTLQILLYYIIIKLTNDQRFNNIKYLGLINPKIGKAYRIRIENIDNLLLWVIPKFVLKLINK